MRVADESRGASPTGFEVWLQRNLKQGLEAVGGVPGEGAGLGSGRG